MIELNLVGGSLGAGKTTWLAAMLNDSGSEAVDFVVVNELARTGLDQFSLTGLARTAQARMIAIEGGCVCCDRLEALRRELRGAVGSVHGSGRSGRIFLETSGAAELAPIVRLVSEDPVLQNNIRLATSTVLVDGVSGNVALRHDRGVRRRMRYADRVVISRADLVAADHIEEIAGLVRGLNPQAAVFAAADGRERERLNPTPLDSPDGAASDPGADGAVKAVSAEISSDTSWAEFAVWLHTLCAVHPARIRRSKSVVPSPRGPLLVQSVGPQIAIPTRAPDGASFGVTLLGTDIDAELIGASIRNWIPSATLSSRG